MLKVSSNALLQQHGSGTEPHVAELIVSVSSICEQAISHLLQELLVTQPCCSMGLSEEADDLLCRVLMGPAAAHPLPQSPWGRFGSPGECPFLFGRSCAVK